jgi:hypothetical protein
MCVEQDLPLQAFSNERVKMVQHGILHCQPAVPKKKAEPLSMRQLEQITSPAPKLPAFLDIDDVLMHPTEHPCYLTSAQVTKLNNDAALKLAFAGFLRTAEVTYERADLKKPNMFLQKKLQRRDVTFADDFQHATVFLRSSKSDWENTGVEIVIAATSYPSCPVKALCALFALDPQPPTAPLFRTGSGCFSRKHYVDMLRGRLRLIGVKNYMKYAGHSLRRGAAQHASDNGILDEDIKRLGRWNSQAFKGYFSTSMAYKFMLNRRFATGRSLPVIRTSLNVAT